MKTCPKCSAENNDDIRFCISCGTSLQSDLEKFLEAQGFSQLAGVMKAHDITSLEVLKELGENDLGELGLAYGDKVRIKVAIESLRKPDETKPKTEPAHYISTQNDSVETASTFSAQSTTQQVNLAEESKKLLKQAAHQGLNKASEILSTTQQALSSTPSQAEVFSQLTGEELDLFKDIEKTYNYIFWGWLTCGILTLAAWWKIFVNGKKVHSELLKSHVKYQNKISWMYVGLAIGLGVIAALIEPENSSKLSNAVNWAVIIWYVRMSWKGRKALKAGQLPAMVAAW